MPPSRPFDQPALRIAPIKPYYFATLNQKIVELSSTGVDIIRIDIGSPDLPPADFIIDTLVTTARRSDVHGYTDNGGTLGFREAIAHFYQNRFQVKLNPVNETLGLLGSKEGIFNLSQVWVNPGDIVLIPDPGYPVYRVSGLIAGAQIYTLPVLRKNQFLPDLDAIPQDILEKAKLLWLNFPGNPTGAVAPIHFFEKAVEFAHRYQILIAHDAPYTNICYEDYQAPSILQVEGSKDVCVEFNSLSKSYNLAGWRLGMVVGNPQVIQYLHTYKSQSDSSHFEAMLQAGIAALTGDQKWIEDRNAVYQYRRDLMVDGLRKSGFTVDSPRAAIYMWASLPPGFTDSMDFCARLLQETGVSVTPGVIYGKYGEGFIRISLSAPTDRLKQAISRITKWLSKSTGTV